MQAEVAMRIVRNVAVYLHRLAQIHAMQCRRARAVVARVVVPVVPCVHVSTRTRGSSSDSDRRERTRLPQHAGHELRQARTAATSCMHLSGMSSERGVAALAEIADVLVLYS